MIEFKDVSFHYKGYSTPAISSINFKLEAGEVVLVTGPSAAVKTTLCKSHQWIDSKSL